MEKYITITKSASSLRASREQEKNKSKSERKNSPYAASPKPGANMPEEIKCGGSSKDQMKWILNNLQDESNPICNPDILPKSQLYSSFSNGHQSSETRPDPKYLKIRRAKQEEQLQELKSRPGKKSESSKVLTGTRIYIDGYLADTTDIEMKKLVKLHGGEILYTASNATHILTSMSLAASKMHRILTTKMRTKVHVVKPEWVYDSLDAGKKLHEFPYLAFKSASAGILPFQSTKTKTTTSSGSSSSKK